MARIRTIKPDFWTDETLGECSPSARLLFIGTWNFADDHGNLERSAKQLRAQVFPYDLVDAEPLVQELLNAGLLVEYEADGKKYLHIKGFSAHQKIENRSKPRHPLPEGSPSPPLDLPEPSALEGKGKGKGKGNKEARERAIADALTRAAEVPGLDLDAWHRWLQYRTELKKPIRAESAEEAARQMAALGAQQLTAVTNSIAAGWQGLFPPKQTPEQARKAREDEGRRAALARIRAHASAIGCSLLPFGHEPTEAYEDRVKRWEREQAWEKRRSTTTAGPRVVAELLKGPPA